MARILIVDDEPTNLDVASVICNAAGYAVVIADDAEQALACLAAQSFDLVLMDVQMPHVDGIALTRTIRENDRWKQIPVIGVTAHVDRGIQAQLREAGAAQILEKPYRNKQLLAVINEVLGSIELTSRVPQSREKTSHAS